MFHVNSIGIEDQTPEDRIWKRIKEFQRNYDSCHFSHLLCLFSFAHIRRSYLFSPLRQSITKGEVNWKASLTRCLQELHIAFPHSSLSLCLLGESFISRIDSNTSDVIVSFSSQMSVRQAILSSFPFIHNMVVYSDDSPTLYLSSPCTFLTQLIYSRS